MSAWHKALKNVQEYEPEVAFSIHCRLVEEGCLCKGSEYYGDAYHQSDLALKKMDFIKYAKAQGWTWDKSGNWLCPECSKEGE